MSMAKVHGRRWRKISSTTSAVAGTRTTHAHGLGKIPEMIVLVAKAADADGALTAHGLSYVKTDQTNITVRASVVSLAFDAYVA